MDKKRKIMTIVGTRPDLIRLSEIIRKMDRYFNHIFVHTGQNFDENLRDKFFEDLDLRMPDYQFNMDEKHVGFKYIGEMFVNIEKVINREQPNIALILGDVNSALSAYVCKQKQIPVFHMEAGNRCYDDKVPEEVNRRIIDVCSEYLLTYTQRSREHLLREGYHPSKIIVTGNPITEIIAKYIQKAEKIQDEVLEKYHVSKKKYVLATLHRTENVTNSTTLTKICNAMNELSRQNTILLSVHPKLDSMLERFHIELMKNVRVFKPFGFIEFLALMKNTKIVITDSGTVPEESCILNIPCVLMRDSTERPELLENNSMILSGIETQDILSAFEIAITMKVGDIPADYKDVDVSDKIIKLLMRKI
ncbi:MAG: non-hydrolyzing UDP-N-acetylglucosamine 2-epimerase [Candidatus Helarchaeota archaeon]